MNICPNCGLPEQACVCTEIAKKDQQIEVTTEKRRFGKMATLVTGLKGVDIKDIGKMLKSRLACGGTTKGGVIELQGNHKDKVKDVLVELGFNESQIKN